MSETVPLSISHDEALVLFEWLKRFNARQDTVFEDQAEQRVLWDLEATLESVLAEPLHRDYTALLNAARSRVRDETE